MFRVIFLLLVVMISTAIAQTEAKSIEKETTKAFMSGEFGIVPNGQLRLMFDTFFVELQNSPSAQGYVFNYGTKKEIAKREKLLRNHIAFRNVDPLRITFVRSKIQEEAKTQLWIVPTGENPPKQ